MSDEKQKNGFIAKIFNVIVIFGGGALLLFFIIRGCITGMRDSSNEPVYDKATAWVTAKNLISKQLKNSSSADFPFYPEGKIAQDDTAFYINSYVDAQNSFGAEIRQNFYAKIIYSPSDSIWTLKELQFK